jgi:translation elongation factor EF-Tu-like GTPase
MVGSIVATLRRSPIVKTLEVIELVEEESAQLLRARVEVTDGSTPYIREAIFLRASKYSYHWQTATGEMLIRWDNAPHHPEIPTYPAHKHEGEQIHPSIRVSAEEVLAEIAAVLKSKGLVK